MIPESVVQEEFDDFLGEFKEPVKKKPRAKSQKEMDKLLGETEELRAARNWEGMTPKHFVALFYALHTRVYGVEPIEVRSQFRNAVGAAMRVLKHQFSGDKEKMVSFVRWTWNNEQKREQKRREKPENNDFRISWGYQFGTTLITNWRLAEARRKKR